MTGPATAPRRPQLCLLTVHAHPDDESSKGAATVHRYANEGVRCVLVCATGGEEGDILNPAMDRPEIREHLHEIRMEELARATEIIGYDEVVMLGYRDSGMPGTPENEDPRCFARFAQAITLVGLGHVIVATPGALQPTDLDHPFSRCRRIARRRHLAARERRSVGDPESLRPA